MPGKSGKWYIWLVAAAVVSALTFTPLVLQPGLTEPFLLGMPRTLWMGIAITAVLVFLTYLAARDAPDESERRADK